MPDGIFKYEKRGQVTWGVRLKFQVADQHNKLVWQAKTWRGFTTQREARQFRDETRDSREDHHVPTTPTKAPTLEHYLQQWLDTYAIPNCKRSTALSYLWIINKYWLPSLGHTPITQITIAHIKTLLTELLEQGKSKQTIRNIFGPVREAFNHAVVENLLPSNPILVLRPHMKQVRDPKRHVHPLSPDQCTALLAATATVDPTLHLATLICLDAGLRPGEILGLQWGDINVTSKELTVRRARVWEHETTPKNHQLRVVDLSPRLLEALRTRTGKGNAYVLTRDSKPLSRSWLHVIFTQTRESTDLPPMRFYDLRHTYASRLIAIGANPKYIQVQMGHSTINVTFDVYGHLFKTERFADQLT